jgi:hypothetical protein
MLRCQDARVAKRRSWWLVVRGGHEQEERQARRPRHALERASRQKGFAGRSGGCGGRCCQGETGGAGEVMRLGKLGKSE